MRRPGVSSRRVLHAAAYVGAWVVLAAVIGAVLFLTGSRTTQIASHDATLRPDLSGRAVLRTGPVLPDVRVSSGSAIGVDIELGKTRVGSIDALVDRYALIASTPEGPQARVREVVTSLALDSALRGGALAVVPLLVFAAVGADRRRWLLRRGLSWRGAAVVVVVAGLAVAVVQPWRDDDAARADSWQSLADFLGPQVPIPAELAGVEVQGDVTTAQTRRLVESAISTFDQSKTFYRDAATAASDLAPRLHQPADGETAVLLVSDRHDNIGMDQVARAVGDAGGATAVLDGGDDTSSGSTWEAFSLDSLDAAYDDAPYVDARWAVPGNHDNGTFVKGYLADHGWEVLDGAVVDGPGGSRLLGTADPRASGLGNWRDEKGLSFGEVEDRLTEAACAAQDAGDRISTILVHDANMASEALDAGCVDLVVGGHTHVRSGPTAVTGSNGAVGYTYTTGTAGGAAYSIAVGSKLRRTADISLLTYRDGRPVGVQAVALQSNGVYQVAPYVELSPVGP